MEVTLLRREFKIFIFEETLDPPIMATNGLSGRWIKLDRDSYSLKKSGPAKDGRKFVIPTFDGNQRTCEALRVELRRVA